MLDRIDLQVHMPRVGPSELIASTPSESSRAARIRIERALARSRARNGGLSNARLPGSSVMDACVLTTAGASRLRDIATSEGMSARAIHRVLRVARTIADLAEATGVDESHVIAALSLREDVLTRRLAA